MFHPTNQYDHEFSTPVDCHVRQPVNLHHAPRPRCYFNSGNSAHLDVTTSSDKRQIMITPPSMDDQQQRQTMITPRSIDENSLHFPSLSLSLPDALPQQQGHTCFSPILGTSLLHRNRSNDDAAFLIGAIPRSRDCSSLNQAGGGSLLPILFPRDENRRES